MNYKLSSDGFAVVNPDWKMVSAKEVTPPNKGVLICGNINTGKTVISIWDDKYQFTHWAPLPVFTKD